MNSNIKTISYIVMGFTLCTNVLFIEQASAAIFKCTSASGTIFYNDKPCPKKDEETEMHAVKDPLNGRKTAKEVSAANQKPFINKSKDLTKVKKKDLKKAAPEKSSAKKKSSSTSPKSTVLSEKNERTDTEKALADSIEKDYLESRPVESRMTSFVRSEKQKLSKRFNDQKTKAMLAKTGVK